ncbi:phosphopantetheine-binding protein [Kitasatospora sp. NPDC085895]|uniref:phosphopantetheine-binding protein n=1 Tax=Kitasatospora sp. NPDC085895 TaxID=3155057 RepID=UPI00344B30AE
MLTPTEIRELIEREARALLLDADNDAAAADDSEDLTELGFNSLTLAQLLIELEMQLGVDPFEDGVSITDMRTIGDLAQAYTAALGAEPATASAGA